MLKTFSVLSLPIILSMVSSCSENTRKNNRSSSELGSETEEALSENNKISRNLDPNSPEYLKAIGRESAMASMKLFSEDKKVVINPVHTQTFQEGAAGAKENAANTIPKTLNLAFVLNDQKCGSIPSYFSEDLNQKISQERKSIEVVSGYLKSSVQVSVLDADVKKMPCVVGISTSEGMAKTQDESGGSAVDFLKSIRLTESQSDWSKLVGNQKVRVAIVDSGLDMDNEDLSSVVNPLYGVDRVDYDDIPEDILGHGTNIASLLISKNQKQKNVRGMSPSNIEILPVKVVPPTGIVLTHDVANGIIHAVNQGAEVINVSLGGASSGCDVVIGYAIDFAIKRNVFVSIAAGNSGALIIPARRDTVTSFESTTNPACWGLYFKGAMTVGSMNAQYDNLLSSSNYGTAVEMLAPGEGIKTYGTSGLTFIKRGTSFAAPIVAGAAAMIIASHKNHKWSYTPWLIEDILLNSSPSKSSLVEKIYKGKYLDLAKTANYLDDLKTKTEQERLAEPYNDPSLGDGYRYADNGTDRLVRLELLTATQLINQLEKGAIRVRAYYASGSYYVVSDKVKWFVSNPELLTIDPYGVVYPKPEAVGKTITISAEYEGFTSSIKVAINSVSDMIGEYAEIEELTVKHEKDTNLSAQFSLIARFNDGAVRNLTQSTTWTSSDERKFRHRGRWDVPSRNWHPSNPGPFLGEFAFSPEVVADTTVQVRASYRGNTVISDYVIKPIVFNFGYVAISTDGTGGGWWNHNGSKGSDEISYDIVKGVRYWFNGKVRYNGGYRTVDSLEVHPGTFISTDDGIKFRKYGSTETPKSEYYGTIPELWIHPDLKPGTYQIRFESDLAYPTASNIKFSVKINLRIDDEKVIKVVSDIKEDVPWGNSEVPHKIFGTYSTGLVKTMVTNDFEITFSDEADGPVEKVWLAPTDDQRGDLKVYDEDLLGKKLNIKIRYKKNNLTSSKLIGVKGLKNFEINRSANIPKISEAPSPKERSGFCTNERKSLRPFAGGKGTKSDPFLICNYEQIKQISLLTENQVSGHIGHLFYKLADHIDASITSSGERFEPISSFKESWFDGDNFEIQNFFIDERESDMKSFFYSSSWNTIENLVFRNANVRGKNTVGILISTLGIRIVNLNNITFIDGTVEGSYYVGALAGQFHSSGREVNVQNIKIYKTRINGSFYTGSIIGVASQLSSKMSIREVYSSAVVSNDGLLSNCVGGLIGSSHYYYASTPLAQYPEQISSIQNHDGLFVYDSLFNGTVTQLSPGTSTNIPSGSVGGIVGCATNTTILDVENKGALTSPISKVGGIVGSLIGSDKLHYGLIFRVKNSGALIAGLGDSVVKGVGGISGISSGSIIYNADSSARVTGRENLGGIVGMIKNYSTIQNVDFNSDIILSGGRKKGAIVGTIDSLVSPDNKVISSDLFDLRWKDTNLRAVGD